MTSVECQVGRRRRFELPRQSIHLGMYAESKAIEDAVRAILVEL